MSITPSQIAASLAQAPLQQRQVSRAADADRDARARSSQRLRQLAEEGHESVEDFYETTDDPMAVKQRGDQDDSGSRHGHGEQPPPDDTPPEAPQHIDVTA